VQHKNFKLPNAQLDRINATQSSITNNKLNRIRVMVSNAIFN